MDPMNTTNREIRTRKEAFAALKEVASGPYAAKRTRLEACLAGLIYLIGVGLLLLLLNAVKSGIFTENPVYLLYLIPVFLVMLFPFIMVVVSTRSMFRKMRDGEYARKMTDAEAIRAAEAFLANAAELETRRGCLRYFCSRLKGLLLLYVIYGAIGAVLLLFALGRK